MSKEYIFSCGAVFHRDDFIKAYLETQAVLDVIVLVLLGEEEKPEIMNVICGSKEEALEILDKLEKDLNA